MNHALLVSKPIPQFCNGIYNYLGRWWWHGEFQGKLSKTQKTISYLTFQNNEWEIYAWVNWA